MAGDADDAACIEDQFLLSDEAVANIVLENTERKDEDDDKKDEYAKSRWRVPPASQSCQTSVAGEPSVAIHRPLAKPVAPKYAEEEEEANDAVSVPAEEEEKEGRSGAEIMRENQAYMKEMEEEAYWERVAADAEG